MRHPIVLWSEENRNGLASSGAARRALVIALVDYPFTEDGHFHLDISDRIGAPESGSPLRTAISAALPTSNVTFWFSSNEA